VIAPVQIDEQVVDLSTELERSRLLEGQTWMRHGVTRRVPGLGRAEGNVGYTAPRDEADAWEMRQLWARAVGVDPGTLTRVRQHHGKNVHLATEADLIRGAGPDAGEAPIADSLITNQSDMALCTLHADCLAMLIADPGTRSVAAVHAGWRSTVLDIAGETVRAMSTTFGSRPSDLLVYVGPSIGIDHYEVGEEVADAWNSCGIEDPPALRPYGQKWQFDLKRANALLLRRAGVSASNIEFSTVCTATEEARWFSHRAQGPLTGRFAAIISIVGDISS